MADEGSYLGIDLGTSAVKVALVGEDGHVVAEGEAATPVSAPNPGWAEADPADWWAALTHVVSEVSAAVEARPPRAIGLAGQMHGIVLCDAAGVPLRPAVLWPDRRAEAELHRWRELPATDRARLANPLVPGMFGPVLSWLMEHEPRVLERAQIALMPKDVLRLRLTEGVVTDRTDASATLLWDVLEDGWARSVAGRTGVAVGLLPDVVAPDQVVGATSWLAGVVDGAPGEVPVVAGAGDTAAALVAVGSAGLQVNLGTGAQVLLAGATAQAADEPSTHLYGDVDGGWYAMAAVQNAGLAVEWARRLLGLEWPDLVAILQAPAGRRTRVTFLPFLTGERGGVATPTSRGAWVGLDQSSTREDLARAALEAMAFTVRRAVELLPHATATDAEVVQLTGGGTREPVVTQLVADALGIPVRRVQVRSASAVGAAMLAARGLGLELGPARRLGPVVNPAARPGLDEAYRRWRRRLAVADA